LGQSRVVVGRATAVPGIKKIRRPGDHAIVNGWHAVALARGVVRDWIRAAIAHRSGNGSSADRPSDKNAERSCQLRRIAKYLSPKQTTAPTIVVAAPGN
jgi:hypothetical protein